MSVQLIIAASVINIFAIFVHLFVFAEGETYAGASERATWLSTALAGCSFIFITIGFFVGLAAPVLLATLMMLSGAISIILFLVALLGGTSANA